VTRSGSKTSELGIRADVKVKGFVMRFGHLQAVLQEGMVVKGTKFAESDNTGTLTQGSHLHLDISKGDKVVLSDHTNFVDPQKFNWNGDYDYFEMEEYMTEDEYREVVANVVNGFYLTYYHRQPTDQEVQAHVNAIAAFTPRKYSISDWVNRQAQEPEFKANYTAATAPNVQIEQALKIAEDKLEQVKTIVA